MLLRFPELLAARAAFVAALVPCTVLAAPAGSSPLARRVQAAEPGAVVQVMPGVHRTHLRIDKPLTLVGHKGAVIDGNGDGDVIRVAAPHVSIRGLTIRHSGSDLTAMNAGIFVEQQADDVDIADNVLDKVLFGVYLDGPARVRVVGNRIRGMTELRSQDRGDGIHLWNDRHVEVSGNDISGTRDGIYIYISPHNRIVNNTIHDVRYGVHYMYSNHDRLAGNVTTRTVAGYALMQSRNLTVLNNRSEQDSRYGILLNYVTYSEFTGNRVEGVTGEKGAGGQVIPGGEGKGLFVYNSEFNRFIGNRIADCPIGIHVTAGSDHNRFSQNAFVHNRVQVKYVQNFKEEWSWNGAGNYWSDYLGWDLDGDGKGDTPYRPNDGVDVLLWKYPQARLLMSSPAVLALRYVQRAFPVFTPPSVQDSHPLMHDQTETGNRKYAQRH